MIDHLSTYATDFVATCRFYDAALAPLGFTKNMDMVASWNPDWPTQRFAAYGPGQKPILWVIEVRTPSTPRHVAFVAKDRAAVDAFYAAARAAGAPDNGPLGKREIYHPDYYGAFVLDPDGNNVEAVCHKPA
jgi:catechol 2,3-dioxygenase-like lactoylglutathione lyase family enzyme